MIALIFSLTLLCGLFSLAYHLTGALLAALVWLCLRLPLAMIVALIGILCCMTLLLIPVGLKLLRAAGRILF